MINPSVGNATGNGDGLSATCEPTAKRGWERRYHHSIIIVDRDGFVLYLPITTSILVSLLLSLILWLVSR